MIKDRILNVLEKLYTENDRIKNYIVINSTLALITLLIILIGIVVRAKYSLFMYIMLVIMSINCFSYIYINERKKREIKKEIEVLKKCIKKYYKSGRTLTEASTDIDMYGSDTIKKRNPLPITWFPIERLDITNLGENKIDISLRNNSNNDVEVKVSANIPTNIRLRSYDIGLKNKMPTYLKVRKNTIKDITFFVEGVKKGESELEIFFEYLQYKEVIPITINVLEIN